MILKVDTDEVQMVIKTMRNDSKELDNEIDYIMSLIKNNLAVIWQGIDSNTFQENVLSYLEKMKSIPNSLTNLSNMMEVINKEYILDDESFSKILEGVSNRYAK